MASKRNNIEKKIWLHFVLNAIDEQVTVLDARHSASSALSLNFAWTLFTFRYYYFFVIAGAH